MIGAHPLQTITHRSHKILLQKLKLEERIYITRRLNINQFCPELWLLYLVLIGVQICKTAEFPVTLTFSESYTVKRQLFILHHLQKLPRHYTSCRTKQAGLSSTAAFFRTYTDTVTGT